MSLKFKIQTLNKYQIMLFLNSPISLITKLPQRGFSVCTTYDTLCPRFLESDKQNYHKDRCHVVYHHFSTRNHLLDASTSKSHLEAPIWPLLNYNSLCHVVDLTSLKVHIASDWHDVIGLLTFAHPALWFTALKEVGTYRGPKPIVHPFSLFSVHLDCI